MTDLNWRLWFRFLGSMNLAIILLGSIAIASVIGTILQQNQPYQNYIVKFGPFWHETYRNLGLYDVYSSIWFIFILSFLVVSVCICLGRNFSRIVHSMSHFKLDMNVRGLQNLSENKQWLVKASPESLYPAINMYLKNYGYRLKSKISENFISIAGTKGRSNRLGYLFTHSAIVIICVGGLLDGNLPLKYKTFTNKLKIETRDVSISELSENSILDVNNPSFRANVSIAEGGSSNYAFINIANGFLLQSLPFSIHVKDFRIEQYVTGQPKSFESDLVIYDQNNQMVLEDTIYVNHPLIYNGYTIYQSSFSDGGSELDLDVKFFNSPRAETFRIKGTVNQTMELKIPDGELKIEFDDFRRFNIFPVDDNPAKNKFQDHGPNFTFKLRYSDGTAREYVNYMYPVISDDQEYFLSGMRTTPNEEFRYLYIPADSNHSIDRFIHFQRALFDDDLVNSIINGDLQTTLSNSGLEQKLQDDLSIAITRLLHVFRTEGFDAIANHVNNNLPGQHQEDATNAYINVLRIILKEIYLKVIKAEGINIGEISDNDVIFFENSLLALSSLKNYGSPFFLELKDFNQRQATGLQITRAPGKYLVYFGFILLIIGVFLLFYVKHQRIWILLYKTNELTEIIMAGIQTRHRKEYAQEFGELSKKIDENLNKANIIHK